MEEKNKKKTKKKQEKKQEKKKQEKINKIKITKNQNVFLDV